jgi:serine/threonine protein kinase
MTMNHDASNFFANRPGNDPDAVAFTIMREVVDLVPAERAVAIELKCGSNPELAARVERLLALASGDATERELMWDQAPMSRYLGRFDVEGSREECDLETALPGTVIGGCTVGACIGRGASSIVFTALQESTGRRIALKVLNPETATIDVRRRFEREAGILGRLRHPNIATVHNAGKVGPECAVATARGLPYISLELVEGAQTIVQACADDKASISARLELFLAACDAVTHAHARGVIHRDLKPGNILIARRSHSPTDPGVTVKVVDFGISLLTAAEASSRTRTHHAIGTLAYMSPEQLRGSDDIDIHSDVYSLGAILFELLCGVAPGGKRFDVSSGLQLDAAPPSPRSSNPDVSRDLDAVVMKALEPERSRRYATVADLSEDVRAFLGSRPTRARPPSLARRAFFAARRHPIRNTLVATALLLGPTVTIGYQWIQFVERQHEASQARYLHMSSGVATEGFHIALLSPEESNEVKGTKLRFAPSAGSNVSPMIHVLDDSNRIVRSHAPVATPPLGLFDGAPDGTQMRLHSVFVSDYLSDHPGRELLLHFESTADMQPYNGISLLRVCSLHAEPLAELWTTSRTFQPVPDPAGGAIIVYLDKTELQWLDPAFVRYSARYCDECHFSRIPLIAALPIRRGIHVLLGERGDELIGDVEPLWAVALDSSVIAAPPALRPSDIHLRVRIDQFERGDAFPTVEVTFANGALADFTLGPQGRLERTSVIDARTPELTWRPLDLGQAQRAAFDAAHAIRTALDRSNAERLIDSSESNPIGREAVRKAVEAMFSNWRWLRNEAEKLVEDPFAAPTRIECNVALDWARRAVRLHREYCTSDEPATCLCAFLPRAVEGLALLRLGAFEEALGVFRAIERNPGYRKGFPSLPEIHVWQAAAMARLGMQVEAAALYREALNEHLDGDYSVRKDDRVPLMDRVRIHLDGGPDPIGPDVESSDDPVEPSGGYSP